MSTELTKKKLKRNRKTISLDTKIQILDRLRNGDGSTKVARIFNLAEATVRTIKKGEQSIRASVAAGTSLSSKHTSCVRDITMETMEKALIIWIEDNAQKKIPIDTNSIREKAVRIFNYIKDTQQSSTNQKTEFSGSKGWFEKFKKRHSLYNFKGENTSPDENGAKEFVHKLSKIIQDGSYTPDQVFNADETGLLWKKIPNRSYLSQIEKRTRLPSDRITLLFCSNASGDYIMKPMLVNRSLNPRSMKGLNKDNLPVHWRTDDKAWVTDTIFKDWFYQCFVPEVQIYMQNKKLNFNVLLLIDNAPGHPIDLYHENVKVVFLPANTSSLIQPLEQGIIFTIKACYIKHAFQKIVDQLKSDNTLDVIQVWKRFSILDCVKIIDLVICEIKATTLNAGWKTIWPEIVLIGNDIPPVENAYSQISHLAHLVGGEGFGDLVVCEIEELVAERDLYEDELVDMVIKSTSDSESDCSDDFVQTITVNTLSKGMEMATKLENYFLENDPSMDRSLRFQRNLRNCLAEYQQIYNELQKK